MWEFEKFMEKVKKQIANFLKEKWIINLIDKFCETLKKNYIYGKKKWKLFKSKNKLITQQLR